MGNQPSSTKAAQPEGCPVKKDASKKDECPVKHGASERDEYTVKHDAAKQDGCPVDHKQRKVYNVYSQEIDPTNMMPANPNQEPNAEQRYPLKQDRVQSTIPKGNTDGTWSYPSEQMFFNALKRKGKGEDVHEGNITTIVSIHNNMNEKAWAQVEHYEKTCHPESDPKLLKFMGRPDDLTPLAWAKKLLGYGQPFDRHDWTILRDDNTEVRYVIDYYFDEEKSAQDETPELHSASSVKSISMYARPALDSVTSVIDRLKYPAMRFVDKMNAPDVTKRQALVASQTEEAEGDKMTVEEVSQTFASIKESCRERFQQVSTCKDEAECSQAATALQFCMAQIVCPTEATGFKKALETGEEEHVEAAFEKMSASLEKFQERSADVMREQAAREATAAE